MREIKFRAWSKDGGKFYYDAEETYDGLVGANHTSFGTLLEDNNYIVEQYTGLKDKNGREIYEGDIVKMPDNQVKPRYKVVKYIKAGFDPFQEGCMGCLSPDGDDVEVIGNIHENPEFLGGEA